MDVVSIDDLLEAIYGKVDDLDEIRKKLVTEGSLSERGWKALYTANKDSYLPADSPLPEGEAFKGLATIFDQCRHAASSFSPSEPMVELTVHGHTNTSTNVPNKISPDATIHLTETSLSWPRKGAEIDHADVCMYMEFKKRDNNTNFNDVSNGCTLSRVAAHPPRKDANELVWNMYHRFSSDPRCRFVCGLTIENTTARLWHFSRAAVMVSEPFDVIEVGYLSSF